MERQTDEMRELSRRAFPEQDVVPDDAPTSIEVTRPACPAVRRNATGRQQPSAAR
ncbi:hypothetical protein AB0B37_41240 [Streptomyces olivaceoviridis]|nr:hypothetical protein [Streptomyces canarius]